MLFTITSCLRDIPHISSGTMEDILCDYHKAQAAIDYADENRDYNAYLYNQAVLKKYGVTQEEFDSSMVYYLRHSDELHKIYEHIHERLSNEALNLGANVSEFNSYDDYSANGDTANIWQGSKFMILSSFKPDNITSFSYKADTAYHKGDKFTLEFSPKFHYQDGYRNGVAVLSIKYKNDSVATNTLNFSMDSYQSMTLESSQNLNIASISGFIMQGKYINDNPSTLKLLFLNNIRLLRFHQKVQKDSTSVSKPDSTSTATADTTKADNLIKSAEDLKQTIKPLN
ncbi:MAG: DUF4296 domain-containing protein [Prevotellaceae bacterium]|nr:DUF4296 domain-containing protein [Prevotellaceae bacterium]